MKITSKEINIIQSIHSHLPNINLNLPSITVIGSQSSGKSSVLESIIKKDILPRGTELVTRCPIILHLKITTGKEFVEFLDVVDEDIKLVRNGRGRVENDNKNIFNNGNILTKEIDNRNVFNNGNVFNNEIDNRNVFNNKIVVNKEINNGNILAKEINKENINKEINNINKEINKENIKSNTNLHHTNKNSNTTSQYTNKNLNTNSHTKFNITKNNTKIKNHLLNLMTQKCGTNKEITNSPITLNLHLNDTIETTIIDLPGLTKLPIGNQPTEIEQQIKNLICTYIKNENTIILAIINSNVDISTSEELKICKKVDPNFERTLGVVTKIDLMDKNTNCLQILSNNIYKLKNGYVGVINKSQTDINNQISYNEMKKKESNYFKNSVYHKLNNLGNEYLIKKVSELYLNKCRDMFSLIERCLINRINELEDYIKGFYIDRDDLSGRNKINMFKDNKLNCNVNRNGHISRFVNKSGIVDRDGHISRNGIVDRDGHISRNGIVDRDGPLNRNGIVDRDGSLNSFVNKDKFIYKDEPSNDFKQEDKNFNINSNDQNSNINSNDQNSNINFNINSNINSNDQNFNINSNDKNHTPLISSINHTPLLIENPPHTNIYNITTSYHKTLQQLITNKPPSTLFKYNNHNIIHDLLKTFNTIITKYDFTSLTEDLKYDLSIFINDELLKKVITSNMNKILSTVLELQKTFITNVTTKIKSIKSDKLPKLCSKFNNVIIDKVYKFNIDEQICLWCNVNSVVYNDSFISSSNRFLNGSSNNTNSNSVNSNSINLNSVNSNSVNGVCSNNTSNTNNTNNTNNTSNTNNNYITNILKSIQNTFININSTKGFFGDYISIKSNMKYEMMVKYSKWYLDLQVSNLREYIIKINILYFTNLLETESLNYLSCISLKDLEEIEEYKREYYKIINEIQVLYSLYDEVRNCR